MAEDQTIQNVLSKEQEDFFYDQGYIIIPNAISKEHCDKTLNEIWSTVENYNGISRTNPDTWSQWPFNRRGFIDAFPIYHLQSIWDIRQSPTVYGAFAQLLQQKKLWTSLDRVSLKRPGIVKGKPMNDWQCDDWYHTDLNPHFLPEKLTLQGFIALTDTSEDQGSLHVIPEWHKDIKQWTQDYPELQVPKSRVLCEFKDHGVINTRTKKLSFKAGDLLIFDSRLVHGSYGNKTPRFRSFVYVTYSKAEENNQDRKHERRESYLTGKAPGLSPSGHPTPQQKASRKHENYNPPMLTPLGRKLLGLESWNE